MSLTFIHNISLDELSLESIAVHDDGRTIMNIVKWPDVETAYDMYEPAQKWFEEHAEQTLKNHEEKVVNKLYVLSKTKKYKTTLFTSSGGKISGIPKIVFTPFSSKKSFGIGWLYWSFIFSSSPQ